MVDRISGAFICLAGRNLELWRDWLVHKFLSEGRILPLTIIVKVELLALVIPLELVKLTSNLAFDLVLEFFEFELLINIISGLGAFVVLGISSPKFLLKRRSVLLLMTIVQLVPKVVILRVCPDQASF